MDTIRSLLPQSEGWLPTWLLVVGVISFGNSIQSYQTMEFTERIYCGRHGSSEKGKAHLTTASNPLQSRTFGTWTFLTGIVRLYAAYHINDPAFYQLAMWGYIVALAHFSLEWLYFGTTKWGKPLAGPIIVSTTSLAWMLSQWGYYVK